MAETKTQSSMNKERAATVIGGALLLLLAIGWGWSFVHARNVTSTASSNGEVVGGAAGAIAAGLTNRDAPTAAYLTNAALDLITSRMIRSQLGASGRLRATFKTSGGIMADSLPAGGEIKYTSGADTTAQPTHSGIWGLVL